FLLSAPLAPPARTRLLAALRERFFLQSILPCYNSNSMINAAHQKCIDPDCQAKFPIDKALITCPSCAQSGKSSLLDIEYDWDKLDVPSSLSSFGQLGQHTPGNSLDSSGVWRFRKLLPF